MQLVKYLRHFTSNGDLVPWGCVVAIGPGQVGWSMCHEKDNFNKKLARTIAAGRAAYNHNGVALRDSVNPSTLAEKMLKRPYAIVAEDGQIRREADVLAEALDEMINRSHRYWQQEVANESR